MSTAVSQLRRKADEYRALGEEHCTPEDPRRGFYLAVEAALRETADALEHEHQREQAA